MPPKKKRDEDYRTSSSDDLSDDLDYDSEDEPQKKRKKRSYSSDDEYDPVRDNVVQATSYKHSKRPVRPRDATAAASGQQSNANTNGHNFFQSVSTAIASPPHQRQQQLLHQMAASTNPVALTQMPTAYLIPANFNLSVLTNPLVATPAVAKPVNQRQIAPQPAVAASSSVVVEEVIDLDDDDDEKDERGGGVGDKLAASIATTAGPIVSARKSDFENTILNELTALVAPVLTLNMQCDTVAAEFEHCLSEGQSERPLSQPTNSPEYVVDTRRTVFNDDLVLSCATAFTVEDDSYAYSEELTPKQRSDYESKLKAFNTYSQIYNSRSNGGYEMTPVNLTETNETLEQYKDRLRREMKAAAASSQSSNSWSRDSNSRNMVSNQQHPQGQYSAQTAAKSTSRLAHIYRKP